MSLLMACVLLACAAVGSALGVCAAAWNRWHRQSALWRQPTSAFEVLLERPQHS